MSKTGFQRRKEREAKYGASYKLVEDLEGCCVYCGRPSKNGRDHVPPLAFVGRFPDAPRLLYSACYLCNQKLAAYPSSCLPERAEFLICALRREWLFMKAGMAKKWTKEQVAINGIAVKARLASGEIRGQCRCVVCEKKNGAFKPRSKMPYAGKEEGQGIKPEWDYYDDGLTTGV